MPASASRVGGAHSPESTSATARGSEALRTHGTSSSAGMQSIDVGAKKSGRAVGTSTSENRSAEPSGSRVRT